MGAYNSSVSFTLSRFFINTKSVMEQVILWAQTGSDLKIINSEFAYHFGFAVIGVYGNQSSANIHGSCFHHNVGTYEGGVFFAQDHVSININQSTFWNNTANEGGVMFAQEHTTISITHTLQKLLGYFNHNWVTSVASSDAWQGHHACMHGMRSLKVENN